VPNTISGDKISQINSQCKKNDSFFAILDTNPHNHIIKLHILPMQQRKNRKILHNYTKKSKKRGLSINKKGKKNQKLNTPYIHYIICAIKYPDLSLLTEVKHMKHQKCLTIVVCQ